MRNEKSFFIHNLAFLYLDWCSRPLFSRSVIRVSGDLPWFLGGSSLSTVPGLGLGCWCFLRSVLGGAQCCFLSFAPRSRCHVCPAGGQRSSEWLVFLLVIAVKPPVTVATAQWTRVPCEGLQSSIVRNTLITKLARKLLKGPEHLSACKCKSPRSVGERGAHSLQDSRESCPVKGLTVDVPMSPTHM